MLYDSKGFGPIFDVNCIEADQIWLYLRYLFLPRSIDTCLQLSLLIVLKGSNALAK